MPVFSKQAEGILVISVDGDYTSAELKRVGSAAVEDPAAPPLVLLDMSGAAGLKNRSVDELRETAHHFATAGDRLEAVAVLAPDDLSYGLMRVGMAFFNIGDGARRAKVFRQRAEAVAWLREGDQA